MIIVELCDMLAYDHEVEFHKMGMLLLPDLTILEGCLNNNTKGKSRNLFYAWKDVFLEAAKENPHGYEHLVHNKLAHYFAVIGEEDLFEAAKRRVEQYSARLKEN